MYNIYQGLVFVQDGKPDFQAVGKHVACVNDAQIV